eukprot:6177961-Pleurochrysis_carterae.AAC.3
MICKSAELVRAKPLAADSDQWTASLFIDRCRACRQPLALVIVRTNVAPSSNDHESSAVRDCPVTVDGWTFTLLPEGNS